ncbi:MAG: methyltransferase, TIGR04325 family, partial [Ignavibacteria bacterium]|nr:methyltransferase, TIGR04325 family [Ignavibacteria bacterium]
MNTIIKIVKAFTPPILVSAIKNSSLIKSGWHGNFKTWEEAKSKTTGYDSAIILDKVRDSINRVKEGLSVYERDSVIFDTIQYSWPLLTGLMMAAARDGGKINVLDFGGSLGSTYYQNKKFLAHFNDVVWSIVEQEHFVKIGKESFENSILKFYPTITDCIKEQSPNVIVLSSVIQYLENPYHFIDSLIDETQANFILIDRTPFSTEERIAIQTVPSSIYKASYPCRIFNLEKFKNQFSEKGYSFVEEFDAVDGDKKSF